MTNYNEIRTTCRKNSHLSSRAIDDFLIGYAAGYQNYEKKMRQHFDRYKHVTKLFKKADVEFFMSQFLAHRIFRENGLIHKIINYPAIQRLPKDEKEYIAEQAQVPWRFSYAKIMEEPDVDFFIMRDVFSEEEYLLYSPGMTSIKKEGDIILWSNLIGYNGQCWQSFGPIGPFKSFDADDIFFFAGEIDPELEFHIEVPDIIDQNPLPFMLLLSGANYPRTFTGEHEIRWNIAEYDLDSLNTAELKTKFSSEYNNGVYRLKHKKLGEQPHFCETFFVEHEEIIIFQSMTDHGYRGLIKDFNTFGFDFDIEPAMRIHPQAVLTASDILKREITINEYQELFLETSEPDPEKDSMLRNMNDFMKIIMPEMNERKTPDIEAAAKKAGLDIETARDLYKTIKEKFESMPGPPPKPPKEVRSHGKKENIQETTGNLYTRIYRMAREIREMEPWRQLIETDIFGIRIPGTDRIYFISVMGANGEFFGISGYKGYEGLARYYNFNNRGEKAAPAGVLELPYFMLWFGDRSELQKEDLEAIKKSGLSFRGNGNWPGLEDHEPGWMPTYPEGDVLEDMPVILEQALWVFSKSMNDPEYMYNDAPSDMHALVRTSVGKGVGAKWKNKYENPFEDEQIIKYNVRYPQELVAAVSKKKVCREVWQADYFLLPAPVKDNEDEKGFFPFLLLLVNKENGIIMTMKTLTPKPDLLTMEESMPVEMLEMLGEMEFRPECLEIRSQILHTLTEKALNDAWVRNEMVDQMPLMDEAIENLMNSART